MQFTIRQSALLDLIQTVSKAVAVRTTKQVLTGILLDASEGQLVATAYDLELGIRDTMVSSEENGLQIEQTGSIVLPARFFNDVIRKLPSDTVRIKVNNNYMTEITSGSAEFHLHGIDAAEFPKLPQFHNTYSVNISGDDLKDLIRSTAFATSNSEVRPVLTGIHLQFKNEKLVFTATDGLRLATRTVKNEQSGEHEWTAIIPGKSLLELAKILPDRQTNVSMQFSESHSMFSLDSTQFYTRLIEGTYPDTSRIIPTSYKTDVFVALEEISGAIDRAALIARDRDNHMVRMEVEGGTITISSSSPEIGNVSESVEAKKQSGDNLTIAFNAKYVLDALKALGEGEIRVQFNGSNHPFTIQRREHQDALQLISPVLMR